MYTKNDKSDIAVMSLSCRPSHNLNLQTSMKRQSDQKFVDGELKVARKSLSTLQTSTDFAFSVDSKWQKLGVSEQAASYFQLVDTNQTSVASFQSQGCSDAQKGLAAEACSKHLGRRMARLSLKIAFMMFAMALARRKQNLLQSFSL